MALVARLPVHEVFEVELGVQDRGPLALPVEQIGAYAAQLRQGQAHVGRCEVAVSLAVAVVRDHVEGYVHVLLFRELDQVIHLFGDTLLHADIELPGQVGVLLPHPIHTLHEAVEQARQPPDLVVALRPGRVEAQHQHIDVGKDLVHPLFEKPAGGEEQDGHVGLFLHELHDLAQILAQKGLAPGKGGREKSFFGRLGVEPLDILGRNILPVGVVPQAAPALAHALVGYQVPDDERASVVLHLRLDRPVHEAAHPLRHLWTLFFHDLFLSPKQGVRLCWPMSARRRRALRRPCRAFGGCASFACLCFSSKGGPRP